MAQQLSETFMQTLQQTEQSGDATQLVELFADNAELANLALEEPLRGRDGAQQFWQSYLHQFAHIRSTFTHSFEAEGKAVLEWEAEGALRDGKPIRYRGVTLLDFDGERVRRFRSYYDSAAFVQPRAQAA